MVMSGKLETQLELQSSAEKFYKVWRNDAHKIPAVTSLNIHGVTLLEGDWDTPESIRLWTYTLGGKDGTFKEKVEFGDANLRYVSNGVGGDVMDEYKVYRPICELIPKENGSIAKLIIEYEKMKEEDPNPDKYMDFFIGLSKGIDAHACKA